MKTEYAWKSYKVANREAWYDKHERTWVYRTLDDEGNQIGTAEHSTNGKLVRQWLKTGHWECGHNRNT